MNSIEACNTFCPVKAVDSDDLVITSWIAAGLFIMSEVLSLMDVEPNGLLQLVKSIFKR
jgi:hypothetical protein